MPFSSLHNTSWILNRLRTSKNVRTLLKIFAFHSKHSWKEQENELTVPQKVILKNRIHAHFNDADTVHRASHRWIWIKLAGIYWMGSFLRKFFIQVFSLKAPFTRDPSAVAAAVWPTFTTVSNDHSFICIGLLLLLLYPCTRVWRKKVCSFQWFILQCGFIVPLVI